MSTNLHIVCLDAPSPPDYGGAIEMYWKIKALAETSVSISLHYFDYKKGRHADDLKRHCKNMFRYERKTFLHAATFSKPYIVASRINRQLIERLNADGNPVLLEGVHCTGIISHLNNKNRKIVVRLHNDEAVYYRNLAKAENNFFKSAYYAMESRLLACYQKTLPANASYAALSQSDTEQFKKKYGLKDVLFIPAFVPWQEVTSHTGKGTYCLYHGNLAVAENKASALWLIQHVFSKTNLPLVVAGKNIPAQLLNAAKPLRNIGFKSNPTEEELTNLIQEAHIHVLPDFNNTGIKLKLLHALFEGRYCITNTNEFNSNTVAVAQTAEEYMGVLKSFMAKAFTEADRTERVETLRLYNNQANAALLTSRLW